MTEVTATLSSPKLLGIFTNKPEGRFYTSKGMERNPLDVVYACVCGVMGVGVMGM